MSMPLADISPTKAQLNIAQWWWKGYLGHPGTAAVALLLATAVLAWGVRPSVDAARKAQLRSQVARMAAQENGRALAVQAASTEDPRDEWLGKLPTWKQRGKTIATLLSLATKAGVEVERAEYAAEDQEPGLIHMQAVLPLSATYVQVRTMVASILNSIPHATVDAIEIEQGGAENAAKLTGRVKLSFYFRSEAP